MAHEPAPDHAEQPLPRSRERSPTRSTRSITSSRRCNMCSSTSRAVGTLLTVVAANIDMGVFNPIIALAIASTKMVIVILFFHARQVSSNLIKMTVGAGFFHVPRPHHHDAVGLHQPRLGSLVGSCWLLVMSWRAAATFRHCHPETKAKNPRISSGRCLLRCLPRLDSLQDVCRCPAP